jgi:hypothetical protein
VINDDPETGLVCLTDLWKAEKGSEKKRPLAWVRKISTQNLLQRLADRHGVTPVWSIPKQGDSSIITSIRGVLETTKAENALRTYAIPELAVAYAKFLSDECYTWALTTLVSDIEATENLISAVEAEAEAIESRKLKRRALLAAGWAVPAIAAIVLNQRASAQVSGTTPPTTFPPTTFPPTTFPPTTFPPTT